MYSVIELNDSSFSQSVRKYLFHLSYIEQSITYKVVIKHDYN